MKYYGVNIEEKIQQVKEELFKKFPDCGDNYTTIVYLWTDEDFKIECRHGRFNNDVNVLHMFTYHDNKIDYIAFEIDRGMQLTESDNLI